MSCLVKLLLISLLCLTHTISTAADFSTEVGICYGQLGNNLPKPSNSIQLIKHKLKAKRVKLYDTNPQILKPLENTNIKVTVMVPNELIKNISLNRTFAIQWVKNNVLRFHPKTLIQHVLVGNEILSRPDDGSWNNLVPAMRNIRQALKNLKLRKIKVGTPMAMDVLVTSFPPSNGTFRADVSGSVIRPVLQFLNRTKSFFFLDVYPYFAWSSDYRNIDLNYALFESNNVTYRDPQTRLTYTNLFDQMVDSVVFAMEKLGFRSVRVWIAETGWPNAGDVDQIGCNVYNAATYNRNVVKRLASGAGTPARPHQVLPGFIFALYNENQKPGPGTERHFGLLYPDGSSVYEIDLTEKTPARKFMLLPAPKNNEPYKGKIWCVVGRKANVSEIASALSYACSQGNNTCDPIKPGRECYKSGSLVRGASYAFSAYWAEFRKTGGSCYFNGIARQTAKDPSYGSCKFPSVIL